MIRSPNQYSPSCSDASTSNDDSERPLLKSLKPEVLLHLSFKQLAIFTFVPSFGALLLTFVVGFGLDYIELLNYEWTCGKVLLPSLSRIINLPKERVVWHMGIMLHAGLRPIFIAQTFMLNSQPPKNSSDLVRFLAKFFAVIGLLSGVVELAFTIALTAVGERESGTIHVYFFIAFIASCCINQLSSNISCRFSLAYKLRRQVRFCLKVRTVLNLLLILLIPSIFAFFVLYWQYCVRLAYDFFASLEYVTVLVIYAYHLVSIIELQKFNFVVIRCKK